jgi:hypothetical protein
MVHGAGLAATPPNPGAAQGPMSNVAAVAAAEVSPRQVFAHYMVCFAAFGESLEGYQREMREAQAAGIDGFALNVGAWSKEPMYPRRVKLIYDAARALNSGFKLFLSIDCWDSEDIREMIRTYGRHPNQLLHLNRIVVSTFSNEGLPWKTDILPPLRAAGFDVFFIPFFYPRPISELPSEAAVGALLETHRETVDGLFYFGAAGLPAQLAAVNLAYGKVLRGSGKLFMAGYSPHCWGHRQAGIGRRYFEFAGGEGTETQWKAILESGAEWVELVSWNDFSESTYLVPSIDPGRYLEELKTPVRSSHAGYLELNRYFIAWFKTRRPPPIEQDALFYFYRPHPMAAVASADDQPVSWRIGDIADAICFTALLTDTVELRVSSGDQRHNRFLPAGLQHTRVPFAPGAQRFEVYRRGKPLLSIQAPPIQGRIERYNFFPISGFSSFADRR